MLTFADAGYWFIQTARESVQCRTSKAKCVVKLVGSQRTTWSRLENAEPKQVPQYGFKKELLTNQPLRHRSPAQNYLCRLLRAQLKFAEFHCIWISRVSSVSPMVAGSFVVLGIQTSQRPQYGTAFSPGVRLRIRLDIFC